jgi:hypothetical protein
MYDNSTNRLNISLTTCTGAVILSRFSVLTASSTFPENAARTTVPRLFSFVRSWIVLGKDDTLTEGDNGS